MDDDVGLLADLDRADPVGHADRFGAGDGGQFECLVGTEAGRVDGRIPGDPGGDRRGAEDVDRVAGVRGVAAECHAAAALDDLGVAAVCTDALAEAQVGPRAVGDGGSGVDDEFDLCVVEPDAVAEQQVLAEHTEIVEVHRRPLPGLLQVPLGVGRRRREVHRHVGRLRPGEVGAAGQECIGREIVSDQGDPALDEAAGRERVDDRRLPLEDLVGRGRERAFLDVPAPHPEGGALPEPLETGGDAVGMRDGAGLDDGRHTGGQRFDGRQHRRRLVVVGLVRGVHRHRPLEDRRARREQVGDAAPDQGITGEVLVGVDHAGRDDTRRQVDFVGTRMGGTQLGRGTDGDDAVVDDGDRTTDENVAIGVHGDDVAVDEQRHAVHDPTGVAGRGFGRHDQPRRGVRENTLRTSGSKWSSVSAS